MSLTQSNIPLHWLVPFKEATDYAQSVLLIVLLLTRYVIEVTQRKGKLHTSRTQIKSETYIYHIHMLIIISNNYSNNNSSRISRYIYYLIEHL